MKLFYLDLETTGVKHWKNGIHQISGMIEIDGVVKEEFDFKVRPNPNAEIDIKALEIAGVSLKQVQEYPPMSEIYKKISDMCCKYVNKYNKKDKFFIVGFNNAHFDNAFFRAFFVQNGDEYFGSMFWSSALDAMVLAADHLKGVRHTMSDFQLKTVARQLGIAVDETKLHDATYDIYLTKEIFKLVSKN